MIPESSTHDHPCTCTSHWCHEGPRPTVARLFTNRRQIQVVHFGLQVQPTLSSSPSIHPSMLGQSSWSMSTRLYSRCPPSSCSLREEEEGKEEERYTITVLHPLLENHFNCSCAFGTVSKSSINYVSPHTVLRILVFHKE